MRWKNAFDDITNSTQHKHSHIHSTQHAIVYLTFFSVLSIFCSKWIYVCKFYCNWTNANGRARVNFMQKRKPPPFSVLFDFIKYDLWPFSHPGCTHVIGQTSNRRIKQKIERFHNFSGPKMLGTLKENWSNWREKSIKTFLLSFRFFHLFKSFYDTWNPNVYVCVCALKLILLWFAEVKAIYHSISCHYCPIFLASTSDFRPYHVHVTHSFILRIHFEEFQTLFGCFAMMPLRLSFMVYECWILDTDLCISFTWNCCIPKQFGKRALSTLIICVRNVTHEALSAYWSK